MQQTVPNTENALCRVGRTENTVRGGGLGAAAPRKRQRPQEREQCQMRNRICLSLEEWLGLLKPKRPVYD